MTLAIGCGFVLTLYDKCLTGMPLLDLEGFLNGVADSLASFFLEDISLIPVSISLMIFFFSYSTVGVSFLGW